MTLTSILAASATSEVKLLVVFLIAVLLFGLLEIKLAWGGLLLALAGFILARREKSTVTVKARGNISKNAASWNFQGSIAALLIIGGIALAIFDIWVNGHAIVAEAKATSRVIAAGIASVDKGSSTKSSGSKDEDQFEQFAKGYTADRWNNVVAHSLEPDREKLQLTLRQSTDFDAQKYAGGLLDGIDTAASGDLHAADKKVWKAFIIASKLEEGRKTSEIRALDTEVIHLSVLIKALTAFHEKDLGKSATHPSSDTAESKSG